MGVSSGPSTLTMSKQPALKCSAVDFAHLGLWPSTIAQLLQAKAHQHCGVDSLAEKGVLISVVHDPPCVKAALVYMQR